MPSQKNPIAWAIVACTLIVAVAAVAITVRLTPTKTTRVVERVVPATAAPTSAPPTTRVHIDRITSGSPNGPVVWTTGTRRDDSSSAYDCCFPSGPNGLAFAGTATCSGTINPVTGHGTVGGFFLDGKRC